MKKLISYISSGDFSYKLKTYINHLEYVNDIRTLREIFILSIKYYNIEVYKYMNKHNFLFREIDVYCRVIPTKKVREAFNFYFNVMDYNNLIDILTKREYLYREFFNNNNKIINLPNYLTNNASIPLINEIKG